MNYYEFVARAPTGKIIKKVKKAKSVSLLKEYLNHKGLTLESCEIINKKPLFIRYLSNNELFDITNNLYFSVSSGIPLNNALFLLLQTTKNRLLKYVLIGVIKLTSKGESYQNAFNEFNKVIEPYFIMMFGTIDTSGKAKEVLLQMKEYYASKIMISKKITNALIYPSIMGVFVFIVILVLLTEIIPNFKRIFSEMSVNIPKYTQNLISLSDFVRVNFAYIISMIIFLILFFITFFHTNKGKDVINFFKLKISLLKNIRKKVATYNFSVNLFMLLSSGKSIKEGLIILKDIEMNKTLKKTYQIILNHMEKGKTFSYSVKNVKFYPRYFIEVLEVSEEIGSTGSALLLLADSYKKEAVDSIEKLAIIIEPVSIIILATIVVGIIAAIYIPMFSMFDGLL